MKTFDTFLSHPDVELIETKVFLIDNEFRPEESRLLETLRIRPEELKKNSKTPDFLIRIRDSSTRKSLGDYVFFEPGGVYRSDIVREVLWILQKNEQHRKEIRKKELEQKGSWKSALLWYIFALSFLFLTFTLLKKQKSPVMINED